MTPKTTDSTTPYADCTLLFQKIVPSYRVPIFRMLYNVCHVIVCHSPGKVKSAWQSFHEQMDFPHILLKSYSIGRRETNVLQSVLPVIRRFRPRIVISEFSIGYFTFWLLFILKHLLGYRLVAWTHGVGNQEVASPFMTLRSRIELFVYRHVDGVLLYSEERKRILEKRIDAARLFVASNTLDTEPMLQQREQLAVRGREAIKKDIGFSHQYNIIFIGRLLNDKRIDLLLESYALLAAQFDVALHIIGDGPEMRRVSSLSRQATTVYAYGAIYDEESIGRYLYAADLLVNPGYVGLSIVHAFSYGTPIVTCRTTPKGPFHSPEIAYLQDGVNGLFSELSTASLAKNIGLLLSDPARLRSMSENAVRTAQKECSPANMLQGFRSVISRLQD